MGYALTRPFAGLVLLRIIVVQIWNYACAKSYIRGLMEIGANAHLEKRRHMLMHLYDEAVRCSLAGHPFVARELCFVLVLLQEGVAGEVHGGPAL